MTTLVIAGGQVITPLEERFTNLCIEGNLIERLDEGVPDKAQVIDASGCYVTPGLFDLQVNGGPGCDLWGDPPASALDGMRQELLKHGVTSFLPTLITDDVAHLKKNIDFLTAQGAGSLDSSSSKPALARMPGIHLEGPCLSPQKPGVHPPQFLQPLTRKLMQEIAQPAVALVTLAPELEPSGESIKYLLEKGVVVSLGHSNADFAQANQAFSQGISLLTHTFNALPPLHHRALGAVGAALLDKQVDCCMICDGLHLAPETAALILAMKGSGRTILVSDAAATGTSQGGLVGSSIVLDQAVQNLVKWGVSDFREAILMASLNPARAVKLDGVIGSLTPGKKADVVLWDKQTLAVKQVILDGKPV